MITEQIGYCEGCSLPILAHQPYSEDYRPGELWHVDCMEEDPTDD